METYLGSSASSICSAIRLVPRQSPRQPRTLVRRTTSALSLLLGPQHWPDWIPGARKSIFRKFFSQSGFPGTRLATERRQITYCSTSYSRTDGEFHKSTRSLSERRLASRLVRLRGTAARANAARFYPGSWSEFPF